MNPKYVDLLPSIEAALSIQKDNWSSKFPELTGPGNVNLFEDDRIEQLLKKLKKIKNWEILELGPLEGGHTYMLEKHGGKVLAIESNVDAFVRCLITKNYFNLKSTFVLGDFTKSLMKSRFDLVLASGVLYHMKDPIDLLVKISATTNRLFVWTHYFDENFATWNENLKDKIEAKWQIDNISVTNWAGKSYRMVLQNYGSTLDWDGFCGGPESESNWLFKDDLLELIKNLGFKKITIFSDDSKHVNGPAICFLAEA